MIKRLVQLVALSLPLFAAAQAPVLPGVEPAASSPAERLLAADPAGQPLAMRGAPVVPIWSGSSGQLLALVPLGDGSPLAPVDAASAYAGPSGWRLAGHDYAGTGLQWMLGNGLRVEGSIGQYLAESSLPCSGLHCGSMPGAVAPAGSIAGTLGMGWTGAGGLDLSYGLSWLERQGIDLTPADLSFGAVAQPAFALSGLGNYALQAETSLFTRARWAIGGDAAMDLAAALGRSRLSQFGAQLAPGLPGVDLDQLSLSLGMDVGSLRGAIIGHVLSSDDPMLAGKRWTTLDLGVSWRTPWSGEFSFGAQNLWSSSPDPSRDIDTQARTPYIQYRQDL